MPRRWVELLQYLNERELGEKNRRRVGEMPGGFSVAQPRKRNLASPGQSLHVGRSLKL